MAWTPRRARQGRRTPAAGSPRPEYAAPSAASHTGDDAPVEPGRARLDRTEMKRAAVSGSVAAATGREWRRVPALKLTIAPVPRLVGGAAFAPPDVSGTRLLLRPPLGASRAQAIAGVDDDRPLTGRVTGLVSSPPLAPSMTRGDQDGTRGPRDGQGSLGEESQNSSTHALRRVLRRVGKTASPRQGPEETPAETALTHADAPPAPSTPPRRTRPVSRARTERASLVEASDEFVGQPQAAETPYASSAWLRMVQSYLPDALGSQIPGMSPPGLTETVKPDGGTVRSWSSAAVAEPPRLPGPSDRDSKQAGPSVPAAPQVPARRASLAESRRLGLGAPLTHPRPQPSEADDDGGDEGAEAEPEQSVSPVHTTPHNTATTPPPVTDVSALLLIGDEHATQEPETHAAAKQRANSEPPPMPHPAPPRPRRTQLATPAVPKPASRQVSAQPGSPVYRAAMRASAVSATPPPVRPHHRGPALNVTGELVHHPLPSPAPREGETKGAPRPAPQSGTEDGWSGLAAPPPRAADAPVQFAPPELAETLRRLHGVDVSNVPIRRDAEAAERAQSLGARAFTDDGQVFIPQSEGSLEQPQTRALLAHELTHAAQHRLLGAGLPEESSSSGRALEAAAVATEHWTLGQALNPGFTEHLPPARPAAPGNEMRAPSQPPAFPPPVVSPPVALGTPTTSAAQVADLFLPPTTQDPAYPLAPAAVPRLETAAALAPITAAQHTAVDRDLTVPVSVAGPARDGESAVLAGQLARLARQRPLDLDDVAAVDELADDLYRRFHSRLRHELLVDRERSGALGDFG